MLRVLITSISESKSSDVDGLFEGEAVERIVSFADADRRPRLSQSIEHEMDRR